MKIPPLLLALLPLALLPACGQAFGHEPVKLPGKVPAEPPEPSSFKDYMVPPPPFSDPDIFPCSDCHDPDILEPNTQRRKLEMAHEDIVLKHDEKNRWCLDCHDAQNRDMLHLANGTLVPFSESYRLCGQCHGDKYRDWRAGIHGKRTGSWKKDGKKEYRLCVHCHSPHSPHFEPIPPKPVPIKPEPTP